MYDASTQRALRPLPWIFLGLWCIAVGLLLVVGVTPLEMTDERVIWGMIFFGLYGGLYFFHRAFHGEENPVWTMVVVVLLEWIIGIGLLFFTMLAFVFLSSASSWSPREYVRYRLRFDPETAIVVREYGRVGGNYETVYTRHLVGPFSYTVKLSEVEEQEVAASDEWILVIGDDPDEFP